MAILVSEVMTKDVKSAKNSEPVLYAIAKFFKAKVNRANKKILRCKPL